MFCRREILYFRKTFCETTHIVGLCSQKGDQEPCKKKMVSFKSIYRRCSVRKGVLRYFAKFTGKHLCQSLFFKKIADLPKVCNFIKKETLALVFSCEVCKISKNTFFTEHFLATASGALQKDVTPCRN